ncbi:MAG: PAS domain S-box protein [Anaerolineae bacterium]|nr:PAS domain S-box protein [Anaerolineae bacterium]
MHGLGRVEGQDPLGVFVAETFLCLVCGYRQERHPVYVDDAPAPRPDQETKGMMNSSSSAYLNVPTVLLEHLPIGIAIFDAHLVLQRSNRLWARFIEGYNLLSPEHVEPGAHLYDLIPGSETQLQRLISQVLRGESVQQEAFGIYSQGVTYYWDLSLAPLIGNGQKQGFVLVMSDATDRKLADRLLSERETQYLSIFEATTDGLLILSPQRVVVEANPAACRLYGYAISELVGQDAQVLLSAAHQAALEAAIEEVATRGEFLVQGLGMHQNGTPLHVELHGVPFSYRGQPHVLVVARDITEQVQAYQLLEQRVEERTHELSTLLEVSNNIVSTLELKPLLNLVLEQVKTVVDYTFASLTILGEERVEVVDWHAPTPSPGPPRRLRSSTLMQALDQIIEQKTPIILANVPTDPHPLNADLLLMQRAGAAIDEEDLCCWMGVPLLFRDRVVGVLSLNHADPGYYTPRHASLTLAFANQVAVAIENARLYEQARELATLHERQRLARELHDAVTQTLFSASLIAEVLPFLWEENPEEGKRRLEDMQRLTRGALAEMRALLLELRPSGLIETPLSDLLRHLTDALTGRTRLRAELTIHSTPRLLPAEVQMTLYRIAQEALNNIIKHARATRINVLLNFQPEHVMLEIQDDGRGFDQSSVPPDHFGLQIMRERAQTIGAHLHIESQPQVGTRIAIVWQAEKDRKRA